MDDEGPLELNQPLHVYRAAAICLASMSFRGDKFDMGQLMALADEYLKYIMGDDAAPIPRPDKTGDITIGPITPYKRGPLP